jgi:two-component system sensor histidine kinase AtoS
LNSVVGNLLNYTRELTSQTVLSDFNSLIKEGVEFIEPMAHGRQVNVEVEYSDTPLLCRLDSVQVKQVIINLLTNGIEACATEEHPVISIRSYYSGEYCCFEVLDNGDGVAPKYKKKIFEPFFTMKDGGIGLGLALSMRIIEAHDGELYECGDANSGAKFVVKLKKEKEVK